MSFLRRFFSTSSKSTINMSEATSAVQKLIDENAVVVFSKSYCPYCKATKSTLSSLDANFEVLELDQAAEGSAFQDALEEINGQRTVPNIYIKQKHIGGNSDLQSLSKSGQLASLLKEAGAVAA